MVANRDSCSCDKCAVVCRGRFPGCASVWAAGPQQVTLTRRPKDNANPSSVALRALPPAPPVGATTAIAPTESATDQSQVTALRLEMQQLISKVDQLQRAVVPGDQMLQAAKEIGTVATALPQLLKETVSTALEMQRHAMFKVFADLERRIVEDVAQLQEKTRQSAQVPGGQPVSMTDLDDRFKWLVGAVSQRFVTLGNEMAKIERLLVDDQASTNGAATNGPAANGSASAVSNGTTNATAEIQAWAPVGDQAKA